MSGKMHQIKIKWMKLLRGGKEYFVAKGARCNKSELEYRCNIAKGADIDKSIIGARTSIGRHTTVRSCIVGKYCAVSWNCSLGAKNHPYTHISGSGAFFQPRFGLVDSNHDEINETPVTYIGNDVWIGCNAVIASGVNIGDGAIIGASAVVTKDVEAYSIVMGVPAKHVRYRFDEQIRKNLMKAKWWDWDDSTIRENITLFQEELTVEISEKLVEIARNR